jgi:hypothetical protein
MYVDRHETATETSFEGIEDVNSSATRDDGKILEFEDLRREFGCRISLDVMNDDRIED